MVETTYTEQNATVSVTNIGGIDSTSVELAPGVNVLAGRNATNRTSFLQALMAACGSTDVAMKGDADNAEVTLEIGEQTYRRALTRQNGSIRFDGDPYLEDSEVADLFAFLLESNEARQAVTTGENLRDIIMRPVDLDEIQAEIARLESRKDEIDAEIEEIEQRKQTLPQLESRQNQLEEELAETRQELTEKEAKIDDVDADVRTQQEEQETLEEKLEGLRETRNKLEDLRYDIDTERESIKSLKQDRATAKDELESLSETPQGEIEEIDTELNRLRERKRHLDSEIHSLQNTIQFNENMLDGERSDVYDAMADDGDTLDELLQDDIVCWTCGSEVPREQIDDTLSDLRNLRQEKLSTKNDITDQLSQLKSDKQSLEQQQERRDRYQRQLSQIETEIQQREERVEQLKNKREDLEAEITELETAVEKLESKKYDEILELHREANQLEYDIGRLETDLEDVEAEIDTIEQRLDVKSELEAERSQVADELTELRTRVESLESEAVEGFNQHMSEVLDTLDYDNLERIWIERVQREVRDGRRKTTKSFFELHVIRTSPSGTTYEDTVSHLSESEREVIGLVFALAGYLAHNVYETTPFMLLDSLEAIDSRRIAELVAYFGEFTDYLVVALLEEDAEAIQTDHTRIESI